MVIDELVSLSKKNITCTAPWDMVQIDVEGKVHLCCNEISKIGHLKKNSFTEIWEGSEAQKYRLGLESKKYYKVCRQCKLVRTDLAGFVRKK